MKKLFTLAILALLNTTTFASVPPTTIDTENVTEASAPVTLTIQTNKASKALVEAWKEAYQQNHKNVTIIVTTKKTPQADLAYTVDKVEGKEVALVGRYAILPITSVENPLIADLKQKEWSKSDLKKLYFSSLDEDLDEDDEANRGKAGKLREKLTVYSGANASSAAAVFAEHFGFEVSELRGNKISGDDLYLLNAIDEDKQSITFNNVAYLYDTASRQLKSGITVLPIKVKDNVEKVLQEGNLDATLQVLEEESTDLIPVEDFGFTYNAQNAQAQLFLKWVISEGQKYNNQNGFLRLAKN